MLNLTQAFKLTRKSSSLAGFALLQKRAFETVPYRVAEVLKTFETPTGFVAPAEVLVAAATKAA